VFPLSGSWSTRKGKNEGSILRATAYTVPSQPPFVGFQQATKSDGGAVALNFEVVNDRYEPLSVANSRGDPRAELAFDHPLRRFGDCQGENVEHPCAFRYPLIKHSCGYLF